MHPHDDSGWQGLDTLWATQPLPAPDLARLRRDALRARLRDRWLTMLDVASVGVAAVVMLRYATGSSATPAVSLVGGVLLAGGIAFAAWTSWNRRVRLRDALLSPAALVDEHRDRLAAARRFWRVNTRVMLALAAITVPLGLAQVAGWAGLAASPKGWLLPAANVPLAIAGWFWARRRDASLARRLDELAALRRELAG